MNFADITNNRHIQSMSPQRQLTIAITLPTTPTDTIYSQCIIQMHQLPANGLSADNIVCNKPEVDQLLFKQTLNWNLIFYFLSKILCDTVFILIFVCHT